MWTGDTTSVLLVHVYTLPAKSEYSVSPLTDCPVVLTLKILKPSELIDLLSIFAFSLRSLKSFCLNSVNPEGLKSDKVVELLFTARAVS
jgi:hypothetical protein